MLPYTFQHWLHGNGSYEGQNWSKLEHDYLPTQLVNMPHSYCCLFLHEEHAGKSTTFSEYVQ